MRRRGILESGGNLTLSSYSGTVSASASSGAFYVYWNDVTLKDSSVAVSSNQTWATPTWNASSGRVTVACTENTDLASSRTAIITVTYSGVSATYILTQQTATLSIDQTSLTLSFDCDSISIYVKVNGKNYTGDASTVTISSNQTWLTGSYNPSWGVSVYAEDNTGNSNRYATLTITIQGQSVTCSITQMYCETITSVPYDGTVDGYKYVTIGGVKWAYSNVGASSPSDYGNYYAWGETTTKSSYTWENYIYNDGTASPTASNMTKYNSTDKLITLESSDDAATANMGGGWRMPTSNELQALRDKSFGWAKYNGIVGIKFKDGSNPSKFVFLPLAGRKSGNNLYSNDVWAYMLSNTLIAYARVNCTSLCIGRPTNNRYNCQSQRFYGNTIRAVHD